MSHLAENRAMSCLEQLVRSGVDRSQLMISFEGMGGHVRVDFIPEGSTGDDLPVSQPATACQRCPRLESDIRGLHSDIDRLKVKASCPPVRHPKTRNCAARMNERLLMYDYVAHKTHSNRW